MSSTKEQSMAYTEILEILKYMPKEEVNKIPKNVIDFYNNNRDNSYNFKIDTNKTFEEQALLEKTKVVLAILFRDYWATDEQREKIKKKEIYDLQIKEKEKSEKYNSNELFKPKEENTNLKVEETALVEYKKEGWITKFIQFMKRVFNKN